MGWPPNHLTRAAGAGAAARAPPFFLLCPCRGSRLPRVLLVEAEDCLLTAFQVLLQLPSRIPVVFPFDLVRQASRVFIVHVEDLFEFPLFFDIAVVVPLHHTASHVAPFSSINLRLAWYRFGLP